MSVLGYWSPVNFPSSVRPFGLQVYSYTIIKSISRKSHKYGSNAYLFTYHLLFQVSTYNVVIFFTIYLSDK